MTEPPNVPDKEGSCSTSKTAQTASKGTAREQAMKKISENPRFKAAPTSGNGYVIGGVKASTPEDRG